MDFSQGDVSKIQANGKSRARWQMRPCSMGSEFTPSQSFYLPYVARLDVLSCNPLSSNLCHSHYRFHFTHKEMRLKAIVKSLGLLTHGVAGI